VLLLIAGCAGLIELGKNASKAVDEAQRHPAPRTAAEKYEHWLDSNSLNRMSDSMNSLNSQYGETLFVNVSIGQYRCGATVDGNRYELLSAQDQRIVMQIVGKLCVKSYRQPFGTAKGNVRRLPDGGLRIEIDDQSGHMVDHDLWYRE
jgi:hypothetical protein